MSATPLLLISFARSSTFAEVPARIEELGYRSEIVSGKEWLARDVRSRVPDVFLIGDEPTPGAGLESFVPRADRAPRLAVVSRKACRRESKFLSLCGDFVTWPCETQELAIRLGRTCPPPARRPPLDPADPRLVEFAKHSLIGRSPAFVEALGMVVRFSKYDAPVLLEGETGTGKELFSRAIHYLGKRRDHPFIPVNCGAIPETLIENELFGHERGAYTGAGAARPGLVEQAAGGTLFLDEVEALSRKGQVSLLRFLQTREFRPVGSARLRQIDVRVIAATNRDLRKLSREGRFREDLLFRLDVLRVELPPLRERRSDIALLAEHFVRCLSARYGVGPKVLTPNVRRWLETQPWPGNVRQLENLIHRAVLSSDGNVIDSLHDPCFRTAGPGPDSMPAEPAAFSDAKARAIDRFERRYLIDLMQRASGNVSQAAKLAGKERRALGRLLKKHALQRTDYL